MSDYDDNPFSLQAHGFWNFSSQVKIRYLRQLLVKFSQQLNDYNENGLVLKLVDDFIVIRCFIDCKK